jgi:hypothetical protein
VITTKNKLLRFILDANSSLYDKKLALEVIYPYKALQELNKKPQNEAEKTNWCNKLCKVLSKVAHDLEHDIKFGELADLLQLNAGLLAL